MKKSKNYQKRRLLSHKVLELYQKAYSAFVRRFNCQFKKDPAYPLDAPVLIENGTRIKQRRIVLRYSRTTYVHKQFERSLDYLFTFLMKKYENINRNIFESTICIRASNDVLRKKIHQEHMNLCELDAQKIVAAYQIYNILNEE